MKQECKLCSVSAWGGQCTQTPPTDFSISSLMRPTASHQHVETRPEDMMLSRVRWYNFKLGDYTLYKLHDSFSSGKPICACSLCDNIGRTDRTTTYGYFQPAGPLINKEANPDAERALARYHPPPHYHATHPPVLPQYGPYYPDLCYNRYYGRPPGSYHIPAPQPDGQMVGVGSEPYPPPQYYGSPPCYQHSPQRIPYVEYRGCPCPLNACPKNVLIGPVTGKAPTGGGPADVHSSLAPPGGAFRAKVRACALEAVADTHGSGKDPPLESEPPAAADAPHPCAMPAIGGVSPKRELYDVRDKILIASDHPEQTEALGPPSPARGSAGICAPQPPPIAPRRARLGKAMARRSLAGDDTGLLLCVPQPSLSQHHSDAEDDVLAISPPACVPIDLSSSDERSTPLVDVKKENEGPTYATARKPDAQALKEHNSSSTGMDINIVPDAGKGIKRRYSRPKLNIDMKNTHLEDECKTNGIGEHVKLQKRRKVSGDQTDVQRIETVTKESKKKQSQQKRTPKSPSQSEKKATKRKSESNSGGQKSKKMLLDNLDADIRLSGVATTPDESLPVKPKTKSALLLDNLMRKNSIDRPDSKPFSDTEINPAELFLSPSESFTKKTNINNNLLESTTGAVNGVRANTIAAVSQLIEKKLASKNTCKLEKVDSKVTHGTKSVLKTPAIKTGPKEDPKTLSKSEPSYDNLKTLSDKIIEKEVEATQPEQTRIFKENDCDNTLGGDVNCVSSKNSNNDCQPLVQELPSTMENVNIPMDNSVKEKHETDEDQSKSLNLTDNTTVKRCKLSNGEVKAKNVEKVVKLLVSKRPAIKTDEVALVIEEACGSSAPVGGVMKRARRRGSHAPRRGRRLLPPPAPPLHEPHAPPRWSNGWNWDGEPYLSKVYLNNDSRQDRTAHCWSRMTHASGDSVSRGDCVLLRPSVARAQPYVARVASLWENPDDGEMMVSLVWYYRPEHTERGRHPADAPDEVFASRHRDANSVACIEDKCYVLTFNEYCRYRKRLKAIEEGVVIPPSIVPPVPASELNPLVVPTDTKLPPSVSPELVLFCRKIYDFRSKKIHMPSK